MTILSRWRKKRYNNAIVVDAQFIRDVVADNVDFPINAMLYDYIKEVSDDELNELGEFIANDDDIWAMLADLAISYAVSMRFRELVEESGIEPT